MRLLRTQWQRLQPALAAMLKEVRCFQEPTFEDFVWAYSAFWSRGQSLPVPVRPAAGGAEEGAAGEEGSGEGGSSSEVVRLEVQEGVVPGLDFANHGTQVCVCVCVFHVGGGTGGCAVSGVALCLGCCCGDDVWAALVEYAHTHSFVIPLLNRLSQTAGGRLWTQQMMPGAGGCS